MPKQFGLGKQERLKSRKQIDELFTSGKSFNIFPLRITYKIQPVSDKTVLQAGVTVSKRFFKKAVERNRIKRLMKEAYRLQKKELRDLLQLQNRSAYIFIIYTDKELKGFKEIMQAMGSCLQRLCKAISNENNS